MIKLSILIPTIVGREESFNRLFETLTQNNKMLFNVFDSNGDKVGEKNDEIEIIYLKDNKEMTIGEKRNKLVEEANGEYISFVDDDDRVSEDYVSELLAGIETGVDVVTFDVSVSLDGATPKPCYYSIHFDKDYNESEAYYRLPNHLMCVKRELALQVPFKEINFGEDADYAKQLKPLLKSEHSIHKILYYYDYNSKTTQTQRR